MPEKRDKTTGLPLPSPVDPGSTVCYTMQIPNAPEYRQALRGVLSELGKAFNWSRTIGQSDEPSNEAAQLWRVSLNTGVFSDDCETDMSCEDVADCIETNEAVQEAIAAQIASNPSNQTTVYNTSVYGAPMPVSERTAPLAEPPDCDLDVLFAMVTAIIDQAHLNNQDFLEILEVALNPTERARNVISAIPGFGLLPVDEAIEVLNQLAEEIQENYDAQWTTALRDELRCALFCIAQTDPDCIVTFDMLTGVFEDRLNYFLDPVNTAAAVLQYFVTSTWAGTSVVDIMMLIQFAFWREASNWLGVNIRTLQIVARLAIDNPDPDHTTLCLDCPAPSTTWEIEEFAGYNSGEITDQTATSLEATSESNTDGYYRISIRRNEGCSEITAFSTSGGAIFAATKYPCGGGPVSGVPIVGDEVFVIYLASVSPFTLSMTWVEV